MQEIKIYNYYSFGYNYYLVSGDSKERTNADFFKWLKRCIDEIENLNLNVVKSSIRLNSLMKDYETLKTLAENTETKDIIVSTELHRSIKTKLDRIDYVLDAELNLKNAFVLSEKRISNEILTGNISKLLPNGYFLRLPSLAQYDFTESGFCLAFDRFTASAFHALRATEEVLKYFYEKTCKTSASDKDTWATYVTVIQSEIKNNKLTPPPSEELLINLDNLRKYYRNKTQHPQLIYSSDEAQDLLSFCTKTISQMIKDLISRKLI